MPVKKKQSSEAAEETIRVVLDGPGGEMSVAELCRREGIASNLYYRWSKDFLEAGKKRLNGDTPAWKSAVYGPSADFVLCAGRGLSSG